MLDLLAEGVESIRLPCSWVLIAPAIGLIMFARRRSAVVIGAFLATVIVIAWIRFAGWWFAIPQGVEQVGLGVVIMVATAVAWRLNRGITDVALAVSAGVGAAWAWIPCVGPELGKLLNGAKDAPSQHLGGTVAFLSGLLLPFVLVAAIEIAIPTLRDRIDRHWLSSAGIIALLAFGALFATTLLDDVSSELARRSSF